MEAGGLFFERLMRMLCLWLVNQLLILTIIVFLLGSYLIGNTTEPEFWNTLSPHTSNLIFGLSLVLGLILAIPTAIFAKVNYYDMISKGFIRWTSAINLWKGEWKFFFKTFFLAWIFFGMTVLFIEILLCELYGII